MENILFNQTIKNIFDSIELAEDIFFIYNALGVLYILSWVEKTPVCLRWWGCR